MGAPGHGAPLDRGRALAVLEEDLAYLEALSRSGARASLPPGRRTPTQERRPGANAGRIVAP